MPKSAYQLFREGTDPRDIGNPQLRQELMRMQQQNYKAQLEQVNANYRAGLDQGLTPGQAATTWVLPNGKNKQYTVKDGDNLTTIATATGTSEADILAANPDMNAPQTGMVLTTPGSEAWRAQNVAPPAPVTNYVGGVPTTTAPTASQMDIYRQGKQAEALRNRGQGGLPSNAAFGTTTTNPQGNNPTVAPGAHNVDFANSPFMKGVQVLKNAFGQKPAFNPTSPDFWQPQQAAQTTAAAATAKPAPTYKKTSYAPRENLVTLLDSITAQTGPTGRLPTDFELKLLINSARVKPVEANVSPGGDFGGTGYYGGYRRRGGYGGGGYGYRGSGGGGYSQKKRAPAFSSGAGFGGLVNWRI